MPTPLQTLPPLRLAVDELPPQEQNHVQIAVRVIASTHKLPISISITGEGDFHLRPAANGSLVLGGVGAPIPLERPIRLMPIH